MEKTEFPEELYADEAVCFIAERHKTTPKKLLRDFLATDRPQPVSRPADETRPLESNEIEILKGLVHTYSME